MNRGEGCETPYPMHEKEAQRMLEEKEKKNRREEY
jgi:hypothetical protein